MNTTHYFDALVAYEVELRVRTPWEIVDNQLSALFPKVNGEYPVPTLEPSVCTYVSLHELLYNPADEYTEQEYANIYAYIIEPAMQYPDAGDIYSIHDAFFTLPRHASKAAYMYKAVLANICDSTLLNESLRSIGIRYKYPRPDSNNPRLTGADIMESLYAIN